jgi:4'-phosphopantetheinyl transferase
MITSVLGADECQVWWGDIEHRRIGSMFDVLTDAEVERAAGYDHTDDRSRFVTACWLLRTVAGAQLGLAPSQVPIDRRCPDCDRPHGKPRIRGAGRGLHVSVAHSGNRVAVALSTAGPVGVDVEERVPADIPADVLSPGERASLRRLPERDRYNGFLWMWVCKEAVLKATGHGLRIPPEQVEITGPGHRPLLLNWPLGTPADALDLYELDPGDGYTAAVAILADGAPVRLTQSDAWRFQRTASPALAAA